MKLLNVSTFLARLVTATLLFLPTSTCLADTITSVAVGNWEDRSTWDYGMPDGNDVVVRHTVTIDEGHLIKFVSSLVVAAEGKLITIHPDDHITIFAEQGDIEINGGAVLASKGSDGPDGGPGAEVVLLAAGDIYIDDASQVKAGDGGTAYNVWDNNNPEATAGQGGRGGDLNIQGRVIQVNSATTVSPGNGGPGGTCMVVRFQGGASATATAGTGGRGGDWYMDWYDDKDVAYVHVGNGERGGNANAQGGPGTPALPGGAAMANGGRGGDSGECTFDAPLPAVKGGVGGIGGPANATGGPGWIGDCQHPGTEGGQATATGGRGGDGLWAGLSGGPALAYGNFGGGGRDAGNGGKAKAVGGRGGDQTDLSYSTGPAGTGAEARAYGGPGGPGASCCEYYPEWTGGKGGSGNVANAQGGYGGTAKHNKGGDGGALWAYGGPGGKGGAHLGAGGIGGLTLTKPGRGGAGPMGRGEDGDITAQAGAPGENGGECEPPPP